jgi:hypothetical protein
MAGRSVFASPFDGYLGAGPFTLTDAQINDVKRAGHVAVQRNTMNTPWTARSAASCSSSCRLKAMAGNIEARMNSFNRRVL